MRFDPRAPTTVRAAVVLFLFGSILEAIGGLLERWPPAAGFMGLWRTFVSPVIWLWWGILWAKALGRLISWVYWLTVMLWLPLVLLGGGGVTLLALWKPRELLSGSYADILLNLAMICYFAVCILLLWKPSRIAFRGVNSDGIT